MIFWPNFNVKANIWKESTEMEKTNGFRWHFDSYIILKFSFRIKRKRKCDVEKRSKLVS